MSSSSSGSLPFFKREAWGSKIRKPKKEAILKAKRSKFFEINTKETIG
jgi:hypothetical protein